MITSQPRHTEHLICFVVFSSNTNSIATSEETPLLQFSEISNYNCL